MRNRQPADQRMDTTSAARPARWRAARPSGWSRRARRRARAGAALDRRAAAAPARSCAFSAACFTFVLLLMLLVGRRGLPVRQPDRCAGAARAQQGRGHPQGRGRARDRRAARARGHRHRSPAVHRRLSVGEVRGAGSRAASRSSSRPATTRSSRRQHPPGDRHAVGRQDHRLPGDDSRGPHQPPDRRAPEGRPQPVRARSPACRRRARCCPRPTSSSAACRARRSSTACRPKRASC